MNKCMKKIFLLGCIATMIACTPTKQSTIDITLQTKVDSILQNKMSEIGAISGQAIVVDMIGNFSIIVSINKIGLPASGNLMAGSVFKDIVDYIVK